MIHGEGKGPKINFVPQYKIHLRVPAANKEHGTHVIFKPDKNLILTPAVFNKVGCFCF